MDALKVPGRAGPRLRRLLSIFLLMACALCPVQGCGQKEEPVIPLRLAVNPGIYSGLIAVADNKGFFQEAGLDLQMSELASGNQCLDSLAKGEVRLATVADFVVARRATEIKSLKIIASIATADPTEIVARKDRDIASPADLKGKRIGTPAKTAALYYLESFLLLNSIGLDQVEIVDIPPPGIAEALASGEVDAICAWDSLVWEAKDRLEGGFTAWPAQNREVFHWLLVMRNDSDDARRAAPRFLQALGRARDFCVDHPNEAKAIVAETWGFETDFIAHYWDKARLSLSLDNSLILSLDAGAAWLRAKGAMGESPDFRQYINPNFLAAVDQRAVTIPRQDYKEAR